jgi:hypothetical protein
MGDTKYGTIGSCELVSGFYVGKELKFMSGTLSNVYSFEARTVKQQKARH